MPSLSWREGERRQPQNDASQCQTRLASVTEGRNVVTAHHCKRQHPDIPRGHAGATCFGEGQEKRPPAFRVSSLLGGSWRSRLAFCGDSVLKRRTRVKFSGMSVFDTQRKCFPERKVKERPSVSGVVWVHVYSLKRHLLMDHLEEIT